MTQPEHFELLVVAGGKGGKTLAMDLATAGRRVAMVERVPEMIGGTCINLACIPTKTLIRSAEVAELVRRAPELGIDATLGALAAPALRRRVGSVVHGMRAMNLDQFRASGMELVIGSARFVGPRRVEVRTADGARVLEGERAVIDLGTRPALPDIPGLVDAAPLTSETLLDLRRIPSRLLIIGGSYVGVELGQAMHRLGSHVTLIERGPQLLGREDEDVAGAVADILGEDGIEVVLGATVERVGRGQDGSVRVSVDGGRELIGDDVLAALGRRPASDGIDLEAAGVELDEHGFVRVDEHLRTTAPGTFAVGDITGGPQFTHVSLDDYRLVKANLDGGARSTAERLVPYCVFLDPELGRVGLTEREARRRGHDVRVAKLPASAIPRAKTLDAPRGLLKAVVDRGSDRILGAAILAAHGGEVIATVQVAMLGGLPSSALRDGILAHPTMAEGLNQLFAAWTDP
ncbi:MAG TPA: FAD-dependent oxidoreductase [Baekduia sp.]|uniref:dihydrolipoyl dehydrogenase family protein n=1 Tax=Baekduia sp. TaxID=2600305 RepID=UPI002D7955F5|nr:FAD-dependent oxidoreductase [Baekduia sp.]HET6509139.1 FAD-dependent oxidoreductase [Baekduia sp.]